VVRHVALTQSNRYFGAFLETMKHERERTNLAISIHTKNLLILLLFCSVLLLFIVPLHDFTGDILIYNHLVQSTYIL
jgi:hypothetical protein